jgi:hypothetical protein
LLLLENSRLCFVMKGRREEEDYRGLYAYSE